MGADSSKRRQLELAAERLSSLLELGEATCGLAVDCSRGGIVLSRHWTDTPWAEPLPDPRFRLVPVGPEQFRLSLYRRGRWERLPFEGTAAELIDVMNSVLAHWAVE